MNKLEVHSVVGKGNLATELVWLQVKEDIQNLSYYVLCDSTFKDGSNISNELRHTYWFPSKAAKKGEWLKLLTKSGVNGSARDEKGQMIHTFYWGLGRTVWNQDRDCAVLFKVENWKTKRV